MMINDIVAFIFYSYVNYTIVTYIHVFVLWMIALNILLLLSVSIGSGNYCNHFLSIIARAYIVNMLLFFLLKYIFYSIWYGRLSLEVYRRQGTKGKHIGTMGDTFREE